MREPLGDFRGEAKGLGRDGDAADCDGVKPDGTGYDGSFNIGDVESGAREGLKRGRLGGVVDLMAGR